MLQMDAGYLPRSLGPAIQEALVDTPVVCLLGPRQAGKSTLTQKIVPDRDYIDLDEAPFAETAHEDPSGFVSGLPEFVTLDEVQRVPDLLRSIKTSVDRNRKPGRFLLTGSANLLLLPQVSDSLAGRMEILQLNPLTESEKEQKPGQFLSTFLAGSIELDVRPTDADADRELVKRLVTGGYPEACARTPTRVRSWHRQYLQSIIERDVQDVAKVRDGKEVARLLEILAFQSGALLNVSNLSRDLGLARATVDRYIHVLERLYLVRILPAWHRNRAKRLVKAPKIHLLDCGLAATLTDLHPDDWNSRRSEFGSMLESFVVQQLVAQGGWTEPGLKFSHYRDKDQLEVDCVISRGAKVWGVEVKTSRSVKAGDARGLRRLADQVGKNFQGGIVLYGGNAVLSLGEDGILAVPLAKLWEF